MRLMKEKTMTVMMKEFRTTALQQVNYKTPNKRIEKYYLVYMYMNSDSKESHPKN